MREELRSRGLDGLLVFSPAGVRYLTGFSGSTAIAVVQPEVVRLFTDGRYALQCRQEVRDAQCVIAEGGLIEEIARRRILGRTKRVAFEPGELSYATYRTLTRRLHGTRLVPLPHLLDDMMEVKSPDEIALIRQAAAISDSVFGDLLRLIRPGVTELEIAGEISSLHRRYGGERDAFEPIVAGGLRGALPHARATSRRIRRGEMLTLDFGCTRGGYHSDITRTVAVGKVSARARRMYRAVLEAHDAAVEAARGGLDARALDAVARRVIVRHGLGRFFLHALGHGLGLQIHEQPRISPRSSDRLRAGSVVTIEPGVYIPDTGGVRIESDVLLLEQGCEMLSSPPGEMIAV